MSLARFSSAKRVTRNPRASRKPNAGTGTRWAPEREASCSPNEPSNDRSRPIRTKQNECEKAACIVESQESYPPRRRLGNRLCRRCMTSIFTRLKIAGRNYLAKTCPILKKELRNSGNELGK